MAAKSTLANMLVCLTVTCAVCSAILGGVYALTKVPIDATNASILANSIKAVLPDGGELSQVKTATRRPWRKCSTGRGRALSGTRGNESERP